MRNKKRTKPKLEDLDRYLGECMYCNQEVSSKQSFVVFVTKKYAHYECMRKADEDKTFENERKNM